MRPHVLLVALIGTLAACDLALGARRGELIPETDARRYGLTRPWFTQVQLDSSRAKISHMVLASGSRFVPRTLFVQTDQAVLHAIDGETGQTLWTQEVGRRGHPSFAPAANEYYVAVVNGSYLYVLNRKNAELLWKTQLEGAPGAGPALSENRVYVPMVDGLVLSYLLTPMKNPLEEMGLAQTRKPPAPGQAAAVAEAPAPGQAPAAGQAPTPGQAVAPAQAVVPAQTLSPEEEEKAEAERREGIRLSQEYVPPLACRSYGRALVQPIVTYHSADEEYVAWPTDRGFLFVGRLTTLDNHFSIRYRVTTEAGVSAQPAYTPANPKIVPDSGVIFVASGDGFVHAISEREGSLLWRFSTAEPILEPPILIGDTVYAVTLTGEMYCLEAKTGNEKWSTHGVEQFIAASKQRLYVADKLNHILVLSAASGTRLASLPDYGMEIKFRNQQTDRIYLASPAGLVQCLHEIEQSEPLDYVPKPPPRLEKPALKAETPQPPPAGQQPAAAPGPIEMPGQAPPAAAGQENPFGGGGAVPPPGGGQANPFDAAAEKGAPGPAGGQAEPPGGAGAGQPAGGAGADDGPFK